MPETLGNALSDLRNRLNETTAAFYTDASLEGWINEGCRTIARKARCLQEKQTIQCHALQQTYQAPSNLLAMHRAEYLPTDSINNYPLEIRNYSEMEAIWGSNQQIEQYYPSFITQWREPPNTQYVLFPVPSSPGILNVFYYRTATAAPSLTSNLDVPEGWWDLAILYAQYTALFKASDSRWADLRKLFNEEMADMMAAAQGYSDAVGRLTGPSGIGPLWQFGGGMDVGY